MTWPIRKGKPHRMASRCRPTHKHRFLVAVRSPIREAEYQTHGVLGGEQKQQNIVEDPGVHTQMVALGQMSWWNLAANAKAHNPTNSRQHQAGPCGVMLASQQEGRPHNSLQLTGLPTAKTRGWSRGCCQPQQGTLAEGRPMPTHKSSWPRRVKAVTLVRVGSAPALWM